MSSSDGNHGDTSNGGNLQGNRQSSGGARLKNTRRHHPKSKQGCGTCKIRRVKCDEAKPCCRRCINFGAECNGYAYLPRLPSHTTQRRDLIPTLVPKQYSQIPSPAEVRTGPRFTDQREAHYFQYYCAEMSGKIAADCRSPIWDRIIPQAGESDTFIAHAIAALGALTISRAMSRSSRSSIEAIPMSIKSNPHYQYALAQYCKSLKLVREGLEGKLWGRSRTALIASLVIFCIESLLGNADAASIHAARSIGLLYTWRHQHAISDKYLCAQDAFEGDLYPAFPGLDLQALLHLDDRPQSVHLGFQRYLVLASEGYLKVLTTIDDCVESCQLLLRRNLHFLAAWRILDGYPDIASGSDDSGVNGKQGWSIALGPLQIPPSKRVEQRSFLEDTKLYRKDLDNFLQPWSKSEHSSAFYIGALCKVRTAMNKILMTAACFPPRTSWDSLLPDFLEIVNLCEKIYPQASSNGGTTYGFDLGPIVPLSMVALRCRNLELRRKAVELLFSRPGYREGIWDAEAMGHVCEWILEIEGQQRDDLSYLAGVIEGEGRLVNTESVWKTQMATLLTVHFELDERRVRPFCAIRVGGEDGEMALRDKVISW